MTTSKDLATIRFEHCCEHEGMERGSNAVGAAIRAFNMFYSDVTKHGDMYERLEPMVRDVSISKSPFEASTAVSLKRIADALTGVKP